MPSLPSTPPAHFLFFLFDERLFTEMGAKQGLCWGNSLKYGQFLTVCLVDKQEERDLDVVPGPAHPCVPASFPSCPGPCGGDRDILCFPLLPLSSP